MNRPLLVATQLPQDAFGPLLEGLEGVEFQVTGPDLSSLDPRAECFVALPSSYGGELVPPPVWPGGVRWVQLLSTGLDGYPDWLFDGVTVTAMQGVNAPAVAEMAMAMVLAGAKRIPQIWQESASWRQAATADLADATLGIVGFGAIGQAVALRAAAFGMDIQAIRASDKAMPAHVRRAASIEELFATSDHVVLALPSSAGTHHLVNAALLARARQGLHLVNVARGEVIDEAALLAALDSGQVGLASLDVLSGEPPALDNPLLHHPRARVSAHIAGNTPGVGKGIMRRLRRNLEAYQAGRPLEGQVAVAQGAD